ncbi:MarR family winged helix-turn-helix transcriptional regulator [Phycicoccus sonneratiae]|uniref:MarR family winged helix-turn-helix transcriptional regulator n=1 Tax=Phycicoccus sonneratiae TaxID=2807628 RepID=UPI0027DC161E|nr:MarR family transcriptional regulator [Phycicoccus sonneraticus]
MPSLHLDDLDLPVLVLLGARATDPWLLAASAPPGVRSLHGYVVQHLVEDRPTVTDLAGRLGVTQQAASKWVAELEELGLVERRPDPADGRSRRVALTDAGRAMVRSARAARRSLEEQVADRVGDADVAVARRVLAALLDVVGAGEAVARRSVLPPSSEGDQSTS